MRTMNFVVNWTLGIALAIVLDVSGVYEPAGRWNWAGFVLVCVYAVRETLNLLCVRQLVYQHGYEGWDKAASNTAFSWLFHGMVAWATFEGWTGLWLAIAFAAIWLAIATALVRSSRRCREIFDVGWELRYGRKEDQTDGT